MWLPAEVTTAPASEPLSVADATWHVKADSSDTTDQAYVLALTKAARAHVESYTGLKLVTQTVKMRRGYFCDVMELPVAPVQSITSVEYLDSAGATQTLDAAVWNASLYGLVPRLWLASGQSWPSVYPSLEAVTVTAVCGFTVQPEEIIHAMKLLVSQWYDNRQPIAVGNSVNELPNAVAALLTNHRIF